MARSHRFSASRARLAPCLALLLAACSSAPKQEEPIVKEIGPQVFLEDEQQPIGLFLASMDVSIRDWMRLTHTARTSEERRMARLLELDLSRRARPRLLELVEQLETGPPQNRVRAASSLGFTRAAEAQSPLLSALGDPDPDVVHNALLGLALLERSDTPLERICALLLNDPDPQMRGQAANTLRTLVQAGGRSDQVLPTARLGIADPEPLVRVQAALVLGMLHDDSSLDRLTDLSHDATSLVRQAAMRAIVLIGQNAPAGKGAAARALVSMLERAQKKKDLSVRRALIELAGVDHGEELQPWVEWAQRLP